MVDVSNFKVCKCNHHDKIVMLGDNYDLSRNIIYKCKNCGKKLCWKCYLYHVDIKHADKCDICLADAELFAECCKIETATKDYRKDTRTRTNSARGSLAGTRDVSEKSSHKQSFAQSRDDSGTTGKIDVLMADTVKMLATILHESGK